MKKHEKIFKGVICIGVIAVLLTMLLTGCVKESSSTAQQADPFAVIEGKESEGLVYNRESKTIYVMYRDSSIGGYSYGYISEYIVNGHNCEYHDGKIVEVIPNYKVVDNKIEEIESTYREIEKVEVKESADDKWNALTEEEKNALIEGK